MANDIDFVSDLNGTGDATVSVNETNVPSTGHDAVETNNQNPIREPTPQAKKLDDTPKQPGEKTLTLRDQISSALKDGEETPAVAAKDGRIRNPDGTFAAAPAAAVDPNAVDPNAPPAPKPVAAPQGIDPAVFQSLPAETQETLARTMEDLNVRQQRVAGMEEVQKLIEPRIAAWAMNNGMTPVSALSQLLALSDYAGRDPAGFIQYMAEQNNVDLEALVLNQAPKEPVDPKVSELEQRVAKFEQEKLREQQQQLQAAHERTVNDVAAFATEKGQDGQLLRPYFEELGTTIMPFISAVKEAHPQMTQQQVLQEAYDQACWGNKSVRAKMQAAVNTASDAERLRADAQKVERARNASASIRSGTPASAPAAPNDPSRSLRDTIRASMAAAT